MSSQIIRKSATVACVTMSSAWLGGILYSYYSIKNGKRLSEFDSLVFSLEGLRNYVLIGGAIGLITSSVFTL
jgi:hypothetical protein